MAPDNDSQTVSGAELTRALAGVSRAMELQTQAIDIHFAAVNRRFDDAVARLERTEGSVNELNRAVGEHRAEINNLYRRIPKPQPHRETPGAEDTNKPVLTYGDLSRLGGIGKALWPLISAVGGSFATWVAMHMQ